MRESIAAVAQMPNASASRPHAPQESSPDPKPAAPEKPLPSDCCESGCETCVYDLYADELAQYRAALAAWRARHPESGAED
ncbi:oxidoreductase-like domain-containing protein [Luteimonas suaedae]|uniref:oxidoreductase-like domain-containing protein n=1 Tax=Luteimonas suaedae TaxID=2605430 RepID=UPI003CCCD131